VLDRDLLDALGEQLLSQDLADSVERRVREVYGA